MTRPLLALAESDANRVVVSRVWQTWFKRGVTVTTTEDLIDYPIQPINVQSDERNNVDVDKEIIRPLDIVSQSVQHKSESEILHVRLSIF